MRKKLTDHVRRYASKLLRPISLSQPTEILWHPSMRPAWVILILGIIISVLIWRLVDMAVMAQARDRFSDLAARVLAKTHLTMTAYEQVLRGGVGLMNVRNDISREEFHRFVSAMGLGRAYPGLQGLGYAVLLKPEEVEAHIKAVRASGYRNYDVHPKAERPVYSTILYLEPLDWRNKRAIGYDMYSEPTRRAAMQRARDEARSALSGRVKLVQETGQDPQPGFLLYMPVYKRGEPSDTLEQRRRNISGFIYAPFRAGKLMTNILVHELYWVPRSMNFAIYDGSSVRASNLMFKAAGFDPQSSTSQFKLVSSSDFFGQTWTFSFSSTPAFDQGVSHMASTLALTSSLLVTCLLFIVIAAKSIRQVQLAQMNEQMALLVRELSHRVKNTLAVVQSIATRSLAGRQSVEEARDVFTKRLHALAHAHTLLFENLWHGASLHALARQELTPFGARANIHGPDIQLNATCAQTLALVLHELATNATKYGAMSVPGGRLDVGWKITSQDGRPTFCFKWTECGGPSVATPTRRGFGRTLLNQRLGHGGTLPEISFAPEGLTYEVTSPLSSITAMQDDNEDMARLLEEASHSDQKTVDS